MKTIGERIRWGRQQKGWSQEKLAEISGIKQGTISKIERSGDIRTSFIPKLSNVLGLSAYWIETGEGSPYLVAEAAPSYGPDTIRSGRHVPVIEDVQAGDWKEIIDAHELGDGFENLLLDSDAANRYSRNTFALRITGDSMLPDLRPGDFVIIDPERSVRPGDIVVAKLDHHEQATIKKYRARGVDAAGYECFELVPFNEDYPTIRVNSQNPGSVIGPVVEHRRMFR